MGAERRVTAADVARSLGISRATVGFVLNNTPGTRISAATRERVVAEAERLGYRPHRAAQDLRRGTSRIILLALPDWPVEYSMRVHLEEASLALDEAGYTLVTTTRQETRRATPLWELLNPAVVMGFTPFSAEEIASMRACGITRILPDPTDDTPFNDAAVITAGPRLQVEYLHDRGHRRLAFAAATDPRISPLVHARLHAAAGHAEHLGLAPLDVRQVDHQTTSATEAVDTWHESGVTGIVAYNDDIAATVVGAAVRAGLTVPGDLSVIGHDDSPIAAMFVPSITSVRLDQVGLGRYFAELALHTAENRPAPPIPDIGASVTERDSTDRSSVSTAGLLLRDQAK